jgi:hypothetical protein
MKEEMVMSYGMEEEARVSEGLDADMYMAQAVADSNHRGSLLSDEGVSRATVEILTKRATELLDGWCQSSFEATTRVVEDNAGLGRPSEEQFDTIQWNAWAASELGQEQNR